MAGSYEEYKKHVVEDVKNCLETKGCQPIIFVGSGMSQRYIKAPTWSGLLKVVVDQCPTLDREYEYYAQSYNNNLIELATFLVEPCKEWAWGHKDSFPEYLFEGYSQADCYLKYIVASHFESISPDLEDLIKTSEYADEIQLLQSISPHSIITTNYDNLLETIFKDHEPVIGQKILRAAPYSLGEIFKIHGCMSDPDSIVLTNNDYDEFSRKKKYLSAKLLAFFAEHPLLLIGYSVSDPNIKAILSDIDEILSVDGEIIPNIYLVQWRRDGVDENEYPQREALISLSEQRSVRIKSIVADNYSWVFKAFSSDFPLERIRPKLLRALLARTYDLVRYDIPKKTIEVDYDVLEHAVDSEGEFGKLFGITSVGDPSKVNIQYPYSLTAVGEKLGYEGWYHANQLIKKIYDAKGVDLKSSDNKYHIAVRSGSTGANHRYSELLVDLLGVVKLGQEYELNV